jgi:hypothetical protein
MFEELIDKVPKFFFGKKASDEVLRIAKLEGQMAAIAQYQAVLGAQFKYLQQRVDNMEPPR